jgi:hypothetical protein
MMMVVQCVLKPATWNGLVEPTCFAFCCLVSQSHSILIERYNAAADSWEHVELPANANPRRSFLAACGLA